MLVFHNHLCRTFILTENDILSNGLYNLDKYIDKILLILHIILVIMHCNYVHYMLIIYFQV